MQDEQILLTKLAGLAFVLALPLVYELSNDANGDTIKDNRKDIYMRIGMFAVAAVYSWIICERPLLPSIMLPFAVFFAFFDYLVAAILIARRVVEVPGANWYSYLSGKKRFDQWLALIPPHGRMALRAVVLIVTVLLYCGIV